MIVQTQASGSEGRLDRIKYYIKQIDDNNKLLLELSVAGLKRFLDDELQFNAGCFLLQRSVGSCINLGLYVIAEHRLSLPDSYRDVFEVLANESIITEELSSKLCQLVTLRNQLVNLDPELEPLSVFKAIRHNLADIVAFEKHVLNWLKPV